MTDRRYLFITWDGGGNLSPLIALARQLARDGDAVTVFGPESQRARIEDVGATLIPSAEREVDDADLPARLDAMTEQLTSLASARDVRAAIKASDPQAVIVDCMHGAGLAAAEKSELPTAVFMHMRYGFFTYEARAEIDSWLREPLATTRANLKLRPLRDDDSVARQMWDRCESSLSMLIPSLETPIEERARNLVHVGPIFEEPAVLLDDPHDPLILVSFSTTQTGQGAVLQNVCDAVAGIDAAVVCTTGGVSAGDLRVPSNVTVESWVDHAALLERASLVVTHVGMGTELASLAHGVPIVGIPMARDQDGNAAQVADLGAGLRLAPTATAEEIAVAITTVMSESSFSGVSRRLARDIAQFENGALARSALGWL